MEAGLVRGEDPGKKFVATVVGGGKRAYRLSEGEYYFHVRNPNRADTDPAFKYERAWRKRVQLGHVPTYVRAAWGGLKSRKPFTWDKFIEALVQLNEPAPRPMKQGPNSMLPVKRPIDCVTRQECMWKHALSLGVAQRRYRAYQRKQKLMQRMVKEVAPKPHTVVFVGNGYDGSQHQKSSTGMPAPTKYQIRYLGARRRVVMVPEFRTSVACAGCSEKPFVSTEAVIDRSTGKVSPVSAACEP